MKAFINQMRAAWHHGRGSIYTRQGNFKLALDHFQAAAKFATHSNGSACTALEIECIARSYARLGDFAKARTYAEESLNQYRREPLSPVVDESIRRVSKFVEGLEKKQG